MLEAFRADYTKCDHVRISREFGSEAEAQLHTHKRDVVTVAVGLCWKGFLSKQQKHGDDATNVWQYLGHSVPTSWRQVAVR